MNTKFGKIENNEPDVIILCGGQGTRIRSIISNHPKSLLKIGERPFLDIILEKIFNQGFSRVILAVGHLKEKIIEHYTGDKRILFSLEETPLGTGGAMMNALSLVKTENFLVMNGDSYWDVDLRKMHDEYLIKSPFLSMALAGTNDASDFGSVLIDNENKLLAYEEKTLNKNSSFINAGIYILNKKIKVYAPRQGNFSLEKDLFPLVIRKEYCYGHLIPGEVLDIGTPERYNIAKQKLAKNDL